ncbi:MAG: hypothetical protein IKY58_04240 [Paludibacteraceae bacterium]|nr:hypothetical protein [Paludibacteraceae bacterium]
MIMPITYDYCYCGKERPQTVCHVMNSLLSSSIIFHRFDGTHHSLSFIGECPHCGFASYYSIDRISGVTYEDIKIHLLEFAKCKYCLKDWCAIDVFLEL